MDWGISFQKTTKGDNWTMKIDKETMGIVAKASVAMDALSNRFNGWSSNQGFESLALALGYPETLSYEDYVERYRKQDIAHRVIKSPVALTWSQQPVISQSDTEDTAFEAAWITLSKEFNIFSRFYKADLLGELGRFSGIFLGMSDGNDISSEIAKGSELIYVSALSEGSMSVLQWDNEVTSSRFGAPLRYNVQLKAGDGQGISRTVHWSRIIHIAPNTLENDWYGIPALRPIYNRLIGLEKLAGGSPEMYWRGARPGYVASTKDNVLASAKTIEAFKEEISKFVNNLNRYLYAEDLEVQSLAPQVVSPMEHAELQIKLISAATRIPVRILIGSERGELSSDQDERAWLTYIEERREGVASRLIIRPFIDRLIEYQAIPVPSNGYVVRWDPLVVMSEKEKAEVVRLYADAIKKYDDAVTIRDFLPPKLFAKYILKFDDEILSKMELETSDTLDREVEEGK